MLAKPLVAETSEKSNLIDDRKFGNLMKSEHSINRPTLVNYVQEADEIDALEEVSCKLSKLNPPEKKTIIHFIFAFVWSLLANLSSCVNDFVVGHKLCLFESSD